MMQITKSKIQHLSILIFVLIGMLMCGGTATAGSYTDSAHGNTDPGYGVNPTDIGYDVGDCVNCYDSCDNEFMLFAPLYTTQSDNVCIQCHQSPGASVQVDMPNQYSYSCTHGGEPEGCPRSTGAAFRFIKENGYPREQCNSTNGSAHRLTGIRNYLRGEWGFGDKLDEINPCSGCHNPHKAKKDWPCSVPSGHDDASTWDVWGDDTDEKMADGGCGKAPYRPFENEGFYLPPYKMGGESEWSSDSDAPDYVYLCSLCHHGSGAPNRPYSTRYGRYLKGINWYDDIGPNHGSGHTGSWLYAPLKPPYSDVDRWQDKNFVLMCTDCHEPHGSANWMLLRTCVNGVDNLIVTPDDCDQFRQWCGACHDVHPSHVCDIASCVGAYGCHSHSNDL